MEKEEETVVECGRDFIIIGLEKKEWSGCSCASLVICRWKDQKSTWLADCSALVIVQTLEGFGRREGFGNYKDNSVTNQDSENCTIREC